MQVFNTPRTLSGYGEFNGYAVIPPTPYPMYPYVAWQAKRHKGDQERLPTRVRKPKQKEKDWRKEANFAKK